jgi:hypothetical protein
MQTEDQIRGDWDDHATHTGKGIIFSPGKFYYEGEIVDGKASGRGRILWESRMVYEGGVADNRANGPGTLKLAEDETAIKGEWLHGEPVLHSRMELNSRSQNMSISFQEIRKREGDEGQGIETVLAKIDFADGLAYEGEIRRKNDGQFKIDGTGTLRFADGSEYCGEFEGGKMHGKGRYRWAATGHWFEGEYKSNFRDGPGTYFYSSSRFKSGIWRAGRLQEENVS